MLDSAMPVTLYAMIGVALLGAVLGVFVENRLVAVLAPIPLIVAPLGAMVVLRPYIERSPLLSDETRDVVLAFADVSVLLQMTIACAGGALLAGVLVSIARAGQNPAVSRMSTTTRARNVKSRVAAVTERTALKERTERLAKPFQQPVSAPQPIFQIAESLTGPVTASSVADRPAVDRNANRRYRGRRRSILAGLLILDDNRSCACRIVDISETGARVRLPTMMPLPDRMWLLNTSDRMAYEVALAWRTDAEAGLNFLSKRDLKDPSTDRDRALNALCVDLAAR